MSFFPSILTFTLLLLASSVSYSEQLCDWNGNIRDVESFCGPGQSPSPIVLRISIGDENYCQGVVYAIESPSYQCTTCQSDDLCEKGEIFGKDCFCNSYCNGVLKGDEYDGFYCEKNANLTCPKGYNKIYVNQGFQRYYKCQKGKSSDAPNGNTTSGGGNGGTSGSGNSSGGGGSNSGGGNSNGNAGTYCKDGKCQKCLAEKFIDAGEKESLDCSEANASCSAYLNIIASACNHAKCGNACACIQSGENITKEFTNFYVANDECKVLYKESNFNSWDCKKTQVKLCRNSQREVSTSGSSSCAALPLNSGCFDFGTSFEAPDNEADCLANGGRWVGAGNGMCHFEGEGAPTNNNSNSNSGSSSSGNGGNGGSGGNGNSGNGNGLTQAELDQSLAKFGEKYGKGEATTQSQLEETIGKTSEGLDGDFRLQLKNVVTSEMSAQMKEFGQKLDKLLQIDGERVDAAFKKLIGKQYEKLSNWFTIKVGDCSSLNVQLILNIDAINVHIDRNLLDDPTACLMLSVMSLITQVGIYLKLIFYLLKT